MPASESRPRVLIVDDTADNIQLLSAFLRKSCEVSGASNGHQALQFARAQPGPDLILLDVVMPGMTGYEVCHELKNDRQTQHIPIIFVTGLNDTGEEEMGLRLGAVDYITKPFHPELVRARVKNHLELKRHRDSLEEEVERRTQALLAARSELEVASRLQRSMLPPAAFRDTRLLGCQVATRLQEARVVGGDLYDYFFLDPKTFLFTLGDVSDKGVPAALFMVRVATLMRLLGPSTPDPASLLTAINRSLCADNPSCMFVTLVCGILKLDTGEVILASGGHEPPLRVAQSGEVELLEIKGGAALGFFPEAEYANHVVTLSRHESLVFYTDGVTEACDREQRVFGEERLIESLRPRGRPEPDHLLDNLMASLARFVGDAEPSDDITVLIIKTHLEENTLAEENQPEPILMGNERYE